MSKMQI